MIRTFIITLLITLCSVCSYGQQSFFDKYAEMEGVTSVYITKSMLSLFPKGQTNVNGVNIGNFCRRTTHHRQTAQRDIGYQHPERIRGTDAGTRRRRKNHHLFQGREEGQEGIRAPEGREG